MCLVIDKRFLSFDDLETYFKSPLIAEEDIIVYKVLSQYKTSLYIKKTGKSPYKSYLYKRGRKYKFEMCMDYDKNYDRYDAINGDLKYELYIEQGLHAWQFINKGCKSLHSSEKCGFITEMIIPKGSKYFLGKNGDIVSNEMIWPTYFKLYTHKLKKYLNNCFKSNKEVDLPYIF